MKKDYLIGLFLIAVLLISGCGQTETQEGTPTSGGEQTETTNQEISTINKQTTTFTDDTFSSVISNPDNYKDNLVDITGKIFTNPEIGEDYIGFQMYWGGNLDLNKNVIVYDYSKGQFESSDCVKVKGTIHGGYEGKNAFGVTMKAVMIIADSIQKLDCKDVIYPSKKVVNVDESETKMGVTLTLEKIEFADEHTRVYLKIENNANNKIHFYSFNAVAFQENKQFEPTNVYDVDYPDIESEIYSGIEEEGVILFEPLDCSKSNAKFQFEVSHDTTYYQDEFVFDIEI